MLKENKMIYWNDDVSEEVLKKAGFNNRNYFVECVHDNITLNISKRKDVLKIDVLDESFLQPYDYQFKLKYSPNFKFAKTVKRNVDKILYEMQELGIISGFSDEHYVYSKYTKDKCYN